MALSKFPLRELSLLQFWYIVPCLYCVRRNKIFLPDSLRERFCKKKKHQIAKQGSQDLKATSFIKGLSFYSCTIIFCETVLLLAVTVIKYMPLGFQEWGNIFLLNKRLTLSAQTTGVTVVEIPSLIKVSTDIEVPLFKKVELLLSRWIKKINSPKWICMV